MKPIQYWCSLNTNYQSLFYNNQCPGSGLDPYSIRLVDLGLDLDSGSGSRRAKMTHKNRKKLRKLIFWSAGYGSLLRAEGISCSLDIRYGGLGISKKRFLFLKMYKKFVFLNFAHRNPKMLFPDPESINPVLCPRTPLFLSSFFSQDSRNQSNF